MIITYHGEGFIKLQQGNAIVAINPISKAHDSKATRFGADISLSSLNHEAFNGHDQVDLASKTPLTISGPGEYELSDIFIKGFLSKGPAGKINTIYALNMEGFKIVHLGALASVEIDSETEEDIAGADILFVPLGGFGSLDPKASAKLATALGSKLIIPILDNDKQTGLPAFLKDAGGESVKPVEKLALKKKDIEASEGVVTILKKV